MTKKIKPPVGRYVSSLPDDLLVSLQKRRSIWLLIGHVLFVISLFISQDCMNYLIDILWLETVYFALMFALIVVMVWAGVFNFRGGKIDRSISERAVPKRGLDGPLTFTVFELQFLLAALWAITQLSLIIWKFDYGGLVITLIAGCTAIAALMVRCVTVKAWRNNAQYYPPAKVELPVPTEEVEDFYASDRPQTAEDEGSDDFYEGAESGAQPDAAEIDADEAASPSGADSPAPPRPGK